MKKKPDYADLSPLDEGKRIEIIADAVMRLKKTVAFIVDNEEKADRYIAVLKAKFPGIVVLSRSAELFAPAVTVKVGPPAAPPP